MTKQLARLAVLALLCAAGDAVPTRTPVPLDKSWHFCTCGPPIFGRYHSAPLRTEKHDEGLGEWI